jgi:MFS transporter, DHA1 family, multidrug resistance protein
MLVIGVSPLVAPTLGGYLTAAFGWQSVFVVLSLLVAGILAAIHFTLPETRPPDTSLSLKPRPILLGFWRVLKNTQFLTYVLTGAIASAGLYAYIAGSPTVFMEIFRVTERHYGWIFAFIAMGLIGSSQLNSLLLRRYTSESIIRVALFCQTVTSLLLFIGSVMGLWGLFGTIFLIFIFLCCQGFVFPNSSALSLAPFSQNAGTASALMGGIQLAIGAFTSALVSFLNDHTALPMTGVMTGCALTSFCLLLAGRRIIRYKARAEDVQGECVEMLEKL